MSDNECSRGNLDMIRYHKFLAAAPWVKEYGSPDIAEEPVFLYKYSPYDQVKPGERYPAMLYRDGRLRYPRRTPSRA